MSLHLERLSFIDITVGKAACVDCELTYEEMLLQYAQDEMWGDIQAYFEIRNWEAYRKAVAELTENSRKIGACKLAELLEPLAVAGREENQYYIESHQPEAMKLYREILEEIEAAKGKQIVEEEINQPEQMAHLLLVDDDTESLDVAEQILSKQFRISRAESGTKALQIIKESGPDLLLIDVYMPGIDGFEMIEFLKREEKFKEIPVVFLTTEHNQEIEALGFKAGAQDFITKPFVAEIVKQRIKRILELSRLQNHLQQEVERQTRQAEERRKQVERLSNQIIEALAETIDAKDSYTNGHSRRVAQYSLEIAKRAGKSEAEQERIFYMGMLHDIGKIGIPDSIITKNSGLSDKEYFVTRKHPEIGAEILATISEIPDLGVGARWHHERYDGTGYPDGLKGTDIPEEARLIAVADAYDAMASKRSYRDVLPQNVVYEEIKKGKGTQFDPEFADIMLTLIDADTAYQMREK